MATVGLSFGSATSGQGFDVATTVTQIQASEQAIETPWQNELTSLTAQDTALSTIGTDLSTLTTSLQALTDYDGVFSEKQGSSSNTDVLTLSSAATTAVSGSHTVLVNSLASTSSFASSTVASAGDTLTGSLTIGSGTGSSTFDVDTDGDNTLTALSAAINAADIGVNASVITDSSGSRLSLVSATSGAAGQLSVSGSLTDSTSSSAVSFTSMQAGADASLTVDGVPITSASNTVSNAIPGVTFVMTAVSATPVQVEITNDNSDIETAMSSFVTAYNAVVTDVNTQEGNDSSGNPEPLYGSPTMALIQSQLTSSLFGGTASGTISNITQLGLSVNDDGTLTLDTDTLDSALNTNFSDVTGFLQNPGSFGQMMSTALNTLGTQAPDGAIYVAQQQNSTEETSLNTDITNENATLATQKTTLTDELNTANEVLQSIPSQLDEINEIYSATTGYNEAQS